MKIRCDDGIVREFTKAILDGDYLPDGTRANLWNRPIEAECVACGYVFGTHSSNYLKPRFRAHVCKPQTPLATLSCKRCQHTWVRRQIELPRTCPKCKSPYWNKPRQKKDAQ